ncbi:HAD family hydrolase [Veronia pacifica]|uniref:Hydrolase n=1 Tax=Veronia pacifica TaxID=1080227 RepID=A0A1C3ES76_9GAMM|nr:HAD family hydrolase [Veronia pacifica]ODA36055.1 hypothetical protein A8L45_00135 [Veronia pacifica]
MKAVLFDLDNTLTDRTASISQYLEIFLRDFSSNLLQSVDAKWLTDKILTIDQGGYGGHDNRCQLLVDLDIWRVKPNVKSLLDHWFTVFPHHPVAMDGMMNMLDELSKRGITMGVITNGKDEVQRAKIRALGIEHFFDCVVTSGGSGLRKPNPDIFLLAARNLNVAANETAFIGDHPINDYCGARQAGMRPVWIEGFIPWPREVNEPEHVVQSLHAIPELLLSL